MMRLLMLLAALCTLAACQDDSPTASAETSPNGTGFTLITLPGNDDVSIHIAWASDWGYRAETPKAAPYVGTQLILAGGAEGYPAGEVVERFADLDAEGQIYVAAIDHVIGELTFAAQDQEEVIAIANAHLRAPAMEPLWFERIRDGLAQNMAAAQAQPAHAGFDAARWAVFGEAPLRNALSLDAPDTFARLSLAAVSAWHEETLTAHPAGVVIAGDLDAARAGQALDALLAGLPQGARTPDWQTPIDLSPKRILLHQPDATTTNLAFIAALPATSAGGEFEDLILAHALGGDDQSALFEAVRTELRASYAFGAGFANYTRAHRVLFMTGEVEDDKLAAAEAVVRQAYADFRAAGLGDDLEARKAPLAENLSDLTDYVVDVARSELQSALDGFAPGRALQLSAELAAITDADIAARLAGGFPGADDFLVIAVSPNAMALPGACVITTPAAAQDC